MLTSLQQNVVDYLKSRPDEDCYVGDIATALNTPYLDVLSAITHLEGKGVFVAEGKDNYFLFVKEEIKNESD